MWPNGCPQEARALMLALLTAALAACSERASRDDAPVATIAGEVLLTRAELYAATPAVDRRGDLRPSGAVGSSTIATSAGIVDERRRQELLYWSLRALVHARLHAMEAARLDIAEKALSARIHATVEMVTDADVLAHHRRAGVTEPLMVVASEIRADLERLALRRAHIAAYGEMERRYEVEYLLEPLRSDVAADGFPSRGPAGAAVTIVEFSDFECAPCAQLQPSLERAKRLYAGTLRFVYRHYPLVAIHRNAWKAAEASLCAHEQGRFWELHELMYAEQGALTVADINAKAARLDLDAEAFARCLDSGRHHDAVQADAHAGDAAGVQGTPTMFVNGRFIVGAATFEMLAAIIDDELRRAET